MEKNQDPEQLKTAFSFVGSYLHSLNSLSTNNSMTFRPPHSGHNASWMITFIDIVALIITFFAMQLAVSDLHLPKILQKTGDSFIDYPGNTPNPSQAGSSNNPLIGITKPIENSHIDYLYIILMQKFIDIKENVTLIKDSKNKYLDIMFSAHLIENGAITPQGEDTLKKVTQNLCIFKNSLSLMPWPPLEHSAQKFDSYKWSNSLKSMYIIQKKLQNCSSTENIRIFGYFFTKQKDIISNNINRSDYSFVIRVSQQ